MCVEERMRGSYMEKLGEITLAIMKSEENVKHLEFEKVCATTKLKTEENKLQALKRRQKSLTTQMMNPARIVPSTSATKTGPSQATPSKDVQASSTVKRKLTVQFDDISDEDLFRAAEEAQKKVDEEAYAEVS